MFESIQYNRLLLQPVSLKVLRIWRSVLERRLHTVSPQPAKHKILQVLLQNSSQFHIGFRVSQIEALERLLFRCVFGVGYRCMLVAWININHYYRVQEDIVHRYSWDKTRAPKTNQTPFRLSILPSDSAILSRTLAGTPILLPLDLTPNTGASGHFCVPLEHAYALRTVE